MQSRCETSFSFHSTIEVDLKMQLLILCILFVAPAIAAPIDDAENINIDWTKVKPITQYPEYWKLNGIQPPQNYENIKGYISNGNVAGRHDFPFKAALLTAMPFGDSLCGGSLISRWAVLTAASCIARALNAVVILGASELRDASEPFQVRFRVQSTNFHIHPFYREGITNSDLGIVRFNFAIAAFTQAVQPVILADDDNLHANVNAIGMGFGRYSTISENFAYHLRFIEVSTMSNLMCGIFFRGQIDPNHICTSGVGGRGVCDGDIGSPLVIENAAGNFVQIGISSFFPESGCMTNNPSVFTRITRFIGFIRQHM